mmetsp:Transcript_18934/g.33653  ORF Transcript_18934/g.33653 Transcript_18934/m.33653 type:complete len:247 (+) Transcript_18934:247-987(+)
MSQIKSWFGRGRLARIRENLQLKNGQVLDELQKFGWLFLLAIDSSDAVKRLDVCARFLGHTVLHACHQQTSPSRDCQPQTKNFASLVDDYCVLLRTGEGQIERACLLQSIDHLLRRANIAIHHCHAVHGRNDLALLAFVVPCIYEASTLHPGNDWHLSICHVKLKPESLARTLRDRHNVSGRGGLVYDGRSLRHVRSRQNRHWLNFIGHIWEVFCCRRIIHSFFNNSRSVSFFEAATAEEKHSRPK